MNQKTLSLYIHWPWCKNKCPYCDFNSHTTNTHLTESYMQSLVAEMEYYSKVVKKQKIDTIFFGGGTPSLMHPKDVEKLIEASEKLFGHNTDIEISLEANPTSSNENSFKDFAKAGVNRFSVGVQSLQEQDLAFLGREHSANQALHTIESALKSGANSVNADFIFGLPSQTLNQWVKDLHTICKLGTQHVSAYQLTIEPNTKFYTQVKRGLWTPLDDDQQADFMNATQLCLNEHNFKQYEVSNYAHNGSECRHNFNIWQYNPYIGIGAGAHGRIEHIDNSVVSTQNYKKISTYIESVKLMKHGTYETSHISEQNQTIEKLLMSLRTLKGCTLTEIDQKFINNQELNNLKNTGVIHYNNSNIRVNPDYILHLETILSKITTL